ncbi:hypothetical protein PVK64_09465 [Aliivibrio sp. S4TY2]|uniref:hypothetical protein n=1 Tax=unclassified Aliivibrio TaxID=2645654 RepID=UPI0023789062|nr:MULTISPECIES: hypothetical protein [unclassified Aliivibrio]MDD9156415.1 hypothetical protein [Aliivibrio sp. S4TY2]MDD9162345.1 hypothetical protein [Aliivibrio sp. S4TY1]MDD9164123.1 hypothetical protein [Aliivibrio sp. S4MY2]MDD9167904.1 hypothetical protein [Aliivibrio sp. S4MY4]MDD9187431.1 hypothetical protein [Aliivibrio sp. S4MY3]
MKITIFNNNVSGTPEFKVNLSNKAKQNYSKVCTVSLQDNIAGNHNSIAKQCCLNSNIRSTSNIIRNTLYEYDFIGAIKGYLVAYNTASKILMTYDIKNKTIYCIKTTHFSSWESDVNTHKKSFSYFGTEALEFSIRTNYKKIITALDSSIKLTELDEVDKIIDQRINEHASLYKHQINELKRKLEERDNEIASLKKKLDSKENNVKYEQLFLEELNELKNENIRLSEIENKALDLFSKTKELGFGSFTESLDFVEEKLKTRFEVISSIDSESTSVEEPTFDTNTDVCRIKKDIKLVKETYEKIIDTKDNLDFSETDLIESYKTIHEIALSNDLATPLCHVKTKTKETVHWIVSSLIDKAKLVA